MSTSRKPPTGPVNASNDKVIDLFSGQTYRSEQAPKIVRLAAELDGFEALYADTHGTPKPGQQVHSVTILFWALLSDGAVVGMIPWFDKLIRCAELNHPDSGFFLGYFDPGLDELVAAAPEHKRLELQAAADYFHFEASTEEVIIQELPDTCGTHAIFSKDELKSFTMTEVFSWRLLSNGHVQAMVININDVERWPVLLGDTALMPCEDSDDFCCFFQYRIAVKLKESDQDLQELLNSLTSEA
ncbi:MAG TPA: hypothetical protein DE179_08375 [Oceanospirillaceae bacterium]|nr:hypothetical protein [Oceanospirillaceae bacterium]